MEYQADYDQKAACKWSFLFTLSENQFYDKACAAWKRIQRQQTALRQSTKGKGKGVGKSSSKGQTLKKPPPPPTRKWRMKVERESQLLRTPRVTLTSRFQLETLHPGLISGQARTVSEEENIPGPSEHYLHHHPQEDSALVCSFDAGIGWVNMW